MAVLSLMWIFLTLTAITIFVLLAKKSGVKVLIGIYSGLVIIAAVAAAKIITIFDIAVPAGVIVYSATFLVTDLISECFGKREAKQAVLIGFLCLLFFFVYSYITVIWPPADFYNKQEAYRSIVGQSGRVAIASFCAFIISQIWDVFIFHYFKRRHGYSKLWLRNIFSTSGSQLIDTVVFMIVAFYGVFPILILILGQYLVKIVIALIDTPFIYIGRKLLGSVSDADV
jgi:uncharacterized integral membrane protein (TIGR00697 family)